MNLGHQTGSRKPARGKDAVLQTKDFMPVLEVTLPKAVAPARLAAGKPPTCPRS